MARTSAALDLQLHQTLRGEADHLAQQIGIRTLLQKRLKASSRRSSSEPRWSSEPTEPYRRPAMTTAVDKRPPAARLSAVAAAAYLPTAPTPRPGTRPAVWPKRGIKTQGVATSEARRRSLVPITCTVIRAKICPRAKIEAAYVPLARLRWIKHYSKGIYSSAMRMPGFGKIEKIRRIG